MKQLLVSHTVSLLGTILVIILYQDGSRYLVLYSGCVFEQYVRVYTRYIYCNLLKIIDVGLQLYAWEPIF